jgi:hypothetical protein
LEDQQLFVSGDDEEGTLEQLPASLKPAYYVHGISCIRMNVIGSRLFVANGLNHPDAKPAKVVAPARILSATIYQFPDTVVSRLLCKRFKRM